MPQILPLNDKVKAYLKKHNLNSKWQKAKELFEENINHPSLNTELLEPKKDDIYSFRLDHKYRALFIDLENNQIEIILVTNHYK